MNFNVQEEIEENNMRSLFDFLVNFIWKPLFLHCSHSNSFFYHSCLLSSFERKYIKSY